MNHQAFLRAAWLPVIIGYVASVLLLLIVSACGGGGGGGSGPPPQVTVQLQASAIAVNVGLSTTLSWSSTNATTCLATSSPAESDWINAVGPSGSVTVTPQGYPSETYSLTCNGPQGPATTSVSITINSAAVSLANQTDSSGAPTQFWTVTPAGTCGQMGKITGVTILPNAQVLFNGQTAGNFFGKLDPGGGFSPGAAGGVSGTWTPTTDGTGMLITYNPAPQLSYCRGRLPTSILNISGSAASGQFN